MPEPEFAKKSVRPAGLADLSGLVDLDRLCFTDPWGVKGIEEELLIQAKESFPRVLLHEEQGAKKAYLIGHLLLDEVRIYRIGVRPEERGKGLAYHLLVFYLRMAREKGAKLCTLEARENNKPALRLYETMGFSRVGYRPNFYKDSGEGAVLLDLELKHL